MRWEFKVSFKVLMRAEPKLIFWLEENHLKKKFHPTNTVARL